MCAMFGGYSTRGMRRKAGESAPIALAGQARRRVRLRAGPGQASLAHKNSPSIEVGVTLRQCALPRQALCHVCYICAIAPPGYIRDLILSRLLCAALCWTCSSKFIVLIACFGLDQYEFGVKLFTLNV
jgi:hypothetical protein